jgi:hypothetical protein
MPAKPPPQITTESGSIPLNFTRARRSGGALVDAGLGAEPQVDTAPARVPACLAAEVLAELDQHSGATDSGDRNARLAYQHYERS